MITAFGAVFFALLMIGSPGLSIMGSDVDVGIADNAAADAGNRVLRLGVVGAVGSIATLNPIDYTMAEEMLVIWPCYSTMLTYDVNVKEIGDLAESWEISPDGLTWTFHLYKSAVFYDKNRPAGGPYEPVTGHDVSWTYFAIQNDTKNNLHSYFPNVGGQPILKKITVGPATGLATQWDMRIELSSRYAPFIGSLHSIPILPKYIWQNQSLTWDNFATGIAPCIGSGPFYYVANGMPSGTTIDLARSPTWFATQELGWKLHVNTLRIRSETSADSCLASFEADLIDVMMWASPAHYEGRLADLEALGLATRFHSSTGFVYEYNLNQMTDEMRADLGGTYNNGDNNQLLLDPVVKLAIAKSYDKQQFIDQVYGGLGQPADSLVPFAHPYYYDYGGPEAPAGEVEVTQDIAGARALLYNNGWKYRTDGSEILPTAPDYSTYYPLCKVGGTSKLQFRFWTLSEEDHWNVGGQLMATWAQQIGVDLWYDYRLLSSNEMNGAWMAADYDMWLWDWVFTPVSEVSVDILSVLTTAEIGSWSDIYWSNPEFDALYNESLVTMDFASRKLITDEMQRITYEAQACQLVAYRADLFAVKSALPDKWTGWGDWSQQWLLDPSQLAPWLYMNIEPGDVADNQAPDISTQTTFEGVVDTGVALTATATDDSTPLEYRWFYGDGTKDATWTSSPSRSHAYDLDGEYTAYVAVRETTGLDLFQSWAKTKVTVIDPTNVPPTGLDFTYSPLDPDAGTIVFLNGTATDPNGDPLYFWWDFGDGYGEVGQQVTHQFTAGVPSTVTMYVDDQRLGSGTRPVTTQKLIAVSSNTAPSWSVGDYNAKLKATVYTYSGTMVDPDTRDNHVFTWNWGDGSQSVTTIPEATHSYLQKGIYTLTTTCDDMTGLEFHNVTDTSLIGVVDATNKPPTLSTFTVDNGFPEWGHTVTFTLRANDQDNDLLSYLIEFGDGETAATYLPAGQTWVVTHEYYTAGYYEVWATITDNRATPLQPFVEVEVADPLSFTLNLAAGYNFVTVPLIAYGYTANLPGLTFGNTVSKWDPATQTFSAGFIVGLSPPATAFAIEPNTGYWIYTSTAKTLTLYGMLPTAEMTMSVEVPSGGGYVAFAVNSLSTTLMASDIVAMFDGTITLVAAWNPSTSSYQSYIPMFPPTNFALTPGLGYWVYCSGSGTFTYTV